MRVTSFSDMDLWNTTTVNVTPSSLLSNCTIDISYQFTFYQESYMVFLLGVVSNSLALRRVCLSPCTMSSTAIYLVSLSAADLCFVLFPPLRVYYYHQRPQIGDGAWSLGAEYCQVTFTLKYIPVNGK